jgi:predicted RNA-binding protein YlqC (UPF0109 family)
VKELLKFIITNIVKHPKSVKIEETQQENNWLVLHLTVHSDDMGQVIGKEGKIIKAVRNILRIKAIKNNIRFSLDLKESS